MEPRKYRDQFGNTAIIEDVLVSAYQGASRKKGYRLLIMSDNEGDYLCDNGFLYFVSVFESIEEAERKLAKFSAGTFECVSEDYRVLYYEVRMCPESTSSIGKYYCKTPILEQAKAIINTGKNVGLNLFILEVCSDGVKRYI